MGTKLSLAAGIVLIGVLVYLVDYADSLVANPDSNSLAMSHPNLFLLIVILSIAAMSFLMVALLLKRGRLPWTPTK